MPLRRRTLALACTLLAVSGLVVAQQPAAERDSGARLSVGEVSAPKRYSRVDVIEYLAFSSGPITDDHPELARVSIPAELRPRLRRASEDVAKCFASLDDRTGPELETAFASADPYRIEVAINLLNATAEKWRVSTVAAADCPPSPSVPSTPPSDGGGFWRTTGMVSSSYVVADKVTASLWVTVAAAAAVTVGVATMYVVLVYLAGVFVPVFILYQFERQPSQLDVDNFIAQTARALGARRS
jgi:hypothetical protein